MYDDFWAGYSYGSKPLKVDPTVSTKNYSISQQQQAGQAKVKMIGTYDKSKFTRMRGPVGEQGEIYANGKMYIIAGPGKTQVRTFPSRPFGIRYMQKKG